MHVLSSNIDAIEIRDLYNCTQSRRETYFFNRNAAADVVVAFIERCDPEKCEHINNIQIAIWKAIRWWLLWRLR